jgi:hypothetical protein
VEKVFNMANREKILEKFSSKFKRKTKIRDDFVESGHKKRRPNWEAERRRKEAQYETEDDE